MLTPAGRRLLWGKSEGYAATHCVNCAAGWVRSGPDGGTLTVCLLDREPILTGLQSCNRYQPQPEPEH